MKRALLLALLVLSSQIISSQTSAMDLEPRVRLTVDNVETHKTSKENFKASRLISALKAVGYAGVTYLAGKMAFNSAKYMANKFKRINKPDSNLMANSRWYMDMSLTGVGMGYFAYTMFKEFKKEGSYALWGKQG